MSIAYGNERGQPIIQTITVTMTADGSGVWTAEQTSAVIRGHITGFSTNPGAGPPQDNWDIVINDEDGVDVLMGAGVDRDTTTSERSAPQINSVPVPIPVNSKLSFAPSGNNVASAVVVITLFVKTGR